jgi:GTP-binding protein
MNIVAIVGRPNVGKSTLFNRMVGARTAIVDDAPGITRDRLYHEVNWSGEDFLVIDTGGIILNDKEIMSSQVLEQVELALEEADVVVFLVDGKNGYNPYDEDVAKMLRRTDKPVILAVNKIDTPAEENNSADFYRLGLGEPISLSAMRGTGGVGDLLDQITQAFPVSFKKPKKEKNDYEYEELDESKDTETKATIDLAIVGKPNVGKSSLLNCLIGKERTIVSDIPGTTRDAIDAKVKFEGQEYVVIDTAGVRRKSKVDYGVEAFAVVRALRAIDRADVAALVIDVNEPVSNQEQKLATKIEEAGKPAIIVCNKWDLIEDRSSRTMNRFTAEMRRELKQLSYAEVIFSSAKNKLRTNDLLSAAKRCYEQGGKKIQTALLNQVMNEAVTLTPPPAGKRSKRLRIYYGTQVDTHPPTFLLFVNDTALMTDNYEQYLERKLREAFNFSGTPIKLRLRARERNR